MQCISRHCRLYITVVYVTNFKRFDNWEIRYGPMRFREISVFKLSFGEINLANWSENKKIYRRNDEHFLIRPPSLRLLL